MEEAHWACGYWERKLASPPLMRGSPWALVLSRNQELFQTDHKKVLASLSRHC